jgi:hypothetical protein
LGFRWIKVLFTNINIVVRRCNGILAVAPLTGFSGVVTICL